MDDTTKRCSKCKEYFPATLEYFGKHKQTKSGLNSWCRKCHNANSDRYHKAHAEQKLQSRRRYYAKHASRINAERREYRVAHLEHIRERERRSAKRNVIKRLERNRRRLHQMRNLVASLTRSQWEETLAYFEYRCAYCGKFWCDVEGVLAQEHVIPVKQGGAYEKGNIVPSCRSCNSRKSGRTPEQAGMILFKPWPPVLL